MIVAGVGEQVLIPADHLEPSHGRIVFEDGGAQDIRLHEHADGFLRADPVHRTGYHRLLIGDAETILAIAPPRCFTAADVSGGAPVWGLTAQIYALRTTGDGGIGTFAGVEALCAAGGLRGADALALSPTHALFSADPNHFSPYSPSTRLFRNPLHADPAGLFGPGRVAAAIAKSGVAQDMAALEALPLVDWPKAAAARMRVYAALYDDFCASDGGLGPVFERFRAESGAALTDHARFEALHAHYFTREPSRWDWRSWAPGHRDSRSPAVAEFAAAHARDVRFHEFLQWMADASQASAQAMAREAGMRIGLICDLAVGMNAGGSHGWMRPDDLLVGLNIGAPPDPLAPRGQNWGLTTFAPRALRASGYAPFIQTLRAQFRHAGGVRIDHVMGLARLWLVPEGEDASHGAYMAYPFGDMLKLVCLESQRHRAIVIGEDLGTVPHGFRETLETGGRLRHARDAVRARRRGFPQAAMVLARRRRDELDPRHPRNRGMVERRRPAAAQRARPVRPRPDAAGRGKQQGERTRADVARLRGRRRRGARARSRRERAGPRVRRGDGFPGRSRLPACARAGGGHSMPRRAAQSSRDDDAAPQLASPLRARRASPARARRRAHRGVCKTQAQVSPMTAAFAAASK